MEIKITKKNEYKFNCEKCYFNSNKKTDYNRHILTDKHNRKHMEILEIKKTKEEFICKQCSKIFNTNSGLWKHKKKCYYQEEDTNKITITSTNENIDDYKELVMKLIVDNQEIKNIMVNSNKELLKENQELKKYLTQQEKQITEMIPLIGNNNNNNNTNNVKQKFNINVFLNEKCKHALSMDEFIDTIEVSMKNLLTTKDKGLGEGLSSIIIDNMNKLSLYERPMHCTDKKRETMYIKNQEWEKDEKLEQIDKLLKRVENKQLKNIEKWTYDNPNFMESEKLQEEYMKIIKGCTSSINDCRDKAIKKLCDKVYLEKE